MFVIYVILKNPKLIKFFTKTFIMYKYIIIDLYDNLYYFMIFGDIMKNIKSYIVTFKEHVTNTEPVIENIRLLGAEVESVQNFIGTAVINTSEDNLTNLRLISDIKAIVESNMVKAI